MDISLPRFSLLKTLEITVDKGNVVRGSIKAAQLTTHPKSPIKYLRHPTEKSVDPPSRTVLSVVSTFAKGTSLHREQKRLKTQMVLKLSPVESAAHGIEDVEAREGLGLG